MTIINVCNLFAPIVGSLIGIIHILILILYHVNPIVLNTFIKSFTIHCTQYFHTYLNLL